MVVRSGKKRRLDLTGVVIAVLYTSSSMLFRCHDSPMRAELLAFFFHILIQECFMRHYQTNQDIADHGFQSKQLRYHLEKSKLCTRDDGFLNVVLAGELV